MEAREITPEETAEDVGQQSIHDHPNVARYEGIRDGSDIIPAGVRERWQRTDKRRLQLRDTYDRIAEDQELTDQAKEERAKQAYERQRGGIEASAEEARKALISQARLNERRALPWPEGQSRDLSNSIEKLTLANSEAERIVRAARRREEKMPKFGSVGHRDYLRDKYREALEDLGGVQGACRCLGVLQAAEELGVSREEIVSVFRTDEQHELLDASRRLLQYSQMVPNDVPPPPRNLQGRQGPKKLRSDRPRRVLVGDQEDPILRSFSPSRRTGRKKRSWK